MPDSPATKARRPADWPAISNAIRTRAGWRCEACGVPNHAIIRRHADVWVSPAAIAAMSRAEKRARFPGQNLYRAVLTVAHVGNHAPADCRPENLQALCQPCHHATHRKGAA